MTAIVGSLYNRCMTKPQTQTAEHIERDHERDLGGIDPNRLDLVPFLEGMHKVMHAARDDWGHYHLVATAVNPVWEEW